MIFSMRTCIIILTTLILVTTTDAELSETACFYPTINNTMWKVVEYEFDYYYGYHDMDFYLRYEDDAWWKWDAGFPFPIGLSGFWDVPVLRISFGFDYGEAEDMYHYQHIIFYHDNCTATTHCYRFLKDEYYGTDAANISYVLHLFKISDDWDGKSPPPQEWDGVHNTIEFDPDYCNVDIK